MEEVVLKVADIDDMPLSLQEELLNLPEDKMPDVIAERIGLIQESNEKFELAEKASQDAKKQLDKALKNADDLIKKANEAGKSDTHKHDFVIFERKTKGDRIADLEDNLKQLVEHNIHAAEAQKESANVQKAVLDSQTALLCVQKAQMEYQGCIADATKFLYGLCALNQSQLGSIVMNLNAIVNGASKEQLGEMALEQLKSTMSQIKSQENIVNQIKKTRNDISNLRSDFEENNNAVQIKFEAQYNEIEEQAKNLRTRFIEQAKTDEKQNVEIAEVQLKNEEQDEKDREHDRKLEENRLINEKQDTMIQQLSELESKLDDETQRQARVDQEHDRLIAEAQHKNIDQDEALQKLSEAIARLEGEINKQEQENTNQNNFISEVKQKNADQDVNIQQLDEKFSEKLQSEVDKQTQKNENLDQAVSALREKNADQDSKIQQASKEFFDKLNGEIERQSQKNTEDDTQFEDILNKYETINEEKTNKSVTYGTMAVAIIAFIMALVQFFI